MPEPQAMTLEEALLYVNRHGARLVHSDTYGGAWEGQRCWYVADRRGSRVSLVCGSWIEALYSFRRDPTLPPGERDDTAELAEALKDMLNLDWEHYILSDRVPERREAANEVVESAEAALAAYEAKK